MMDVSFEARKNEHFMTLKNIFIASFLVFP